MPISEASLEAIRNPTGGKLTQLGQVFAQAQQRKKENEIADKKLSMTEQLNKANLSTAQMEAADLQSKGIGAYSQAVIAEMKKFPADQAKYPQVMAVIQKRIRDSMPEGMRSIIPEETQSMEQLQAGLDNATIYQQWLATSKPSKAPTTRSVRDGDIIVNQEWDAETGEWKEVGRGVYSGAKDSEFERNVNRLVKDKKISKEKAIELIEKRTGILAGTEISKGKGLTEDRMARKTNIEQTDSLHKEYTKGSEHLRNITTNIDAAMAAMDTGDTELSDKLLAQVMSQVQDTDVRAFQMYGEFNKPFGNLLERITGQISRFAQGSRTQEEREVIATTLKHFKQNYSESSLKDMRKMYRNNAVNKELDPFKAVPPTSPEDIRDFPNIEKKEKIRLIKLYFPEVFRK